MASWLRELDDLLRGKKTESTRLAEGTEHILIKPYVAATIVLGLIYGIFMGLFAVLNRTPPCFEQLIASTVKVPALFLLTLVVTFPSLYVFSALLGTRLKLAGTFRIVISATAVTLAVLASLGPITGFFSLTTSSYTFMKLLNAAFFTAAGFIGLGFLLKMLGRLGPPSEEPMTAEPVGPQTTVASVTGVPPSPYARALPPNPPKARRKTGRARAVFSVWLIIYSLVGAQMGWVLRPFIGSPDMEFTWFRARESNIFIDLIRTIGSFFGG